MTPLFLRSNLLKGFTAGLQSYVMNGVKTNSKIGRHKNERINILLTSVGRRNYLVDYFRAALNGSGYVVGVDMNSSAPALSACDSAHLVPSVFSAKYVDKLIGVMRDEKIKMLFSLNDLEATILSRARNRIENETGATVYVPNTDVVETCMDKWATYNYATQRGIPTPKSFIQLAKAELALHTEEVSFPLIVKPRWGSASTGLFKVSCIKSLREKFVTCSEVIQQSSLHGLGQENNVLIQEFIEGEEYGVDVLFGQSENFLGYAAKQKLIMRAGETDKAISVDPTPFKPLILSISATIRHRGNLDCDFLKKDGKLYLLEMNPRFGGGYPFTHLSGANHTLQLLHDYLGKAPQTYRYEVGKSFAKFDSLVEIPYS